MSGQLDLFVQLQLAMIMDEMNKSRSSESLAQEETIYLEGVDGSPSLVQEVWRAGMPVRSISNNIEIKEKLRSKI